MDGRRGGDAVEIWDVRRGWIAKWSIGNSASEGGVAGSSLLLFSLIQVLCDLKMSVRHCIRRSLHTLGAA